jgi:DNA polymerase-3 subunit epsilon
VVDSLALARQMHPGQRNSLDALCKRYNVDNSGRQLHGALLDAQLLGEVYLAMTGGQVALRLGESGSAQSRAAQAAARPLLRPTGGLRVIAATPDEELAHQAFLDLIGKSSKGGCLWQQLEAAID